jgi:YgiT-type zinc finger domain-containing protein
MNCVICKHGQTRPEPVTVTLERGALTLVFKSVPADVCENCGEQYVSAETTRHLLAEAEKAAAAGVQVEVRSFAAA